MLSLKEKRTKDEGDTQEENENSPRHDATGSNGAGVFQNQSGRSSINAINSMRGICVNLNHNSNPSSLFPSVKSYRSSKRVIRSNQYKPKKKPKHRTLQQVMNASFGWKIVIRTNEQRTQRKERFLKKPTCNPKSMGEEVSKVKC